MEQLIIQGKKASAFMDKMAELEQKFSNKYVAGELHDYVKLNKVDDRIQLIFIKPVPEMVRIACTMCFVDTLL
ncbi:hypothetical protein HDF24_05830 [Mucilaginibacter sp. X4EP1]|uniref:hypothetical protein n=1 Tax=Mucilaginibacter sp. X4EP1 TaxID=2723092 RepID=UPI002167434A|nr:hypothetical protein [Mucilaginibacter sp. X4EP1]MCS3814384.1 hypothetical protein [Mucilaginibacter sp. X4EP1]